ncbi:MAG: hypothetical protein HY332_04895 [Chloroflexi bacterium]|nr:hypothetical protein [Chloroflexota bacterium]
MVATVAIAGTGCAAGGDLPVGPLRTEALVRRPAQQLALALADLPQGFRVGAELSPPLDPSKAAADPWGRVSAYAVTFIAAAADQQPAPALGDVISSVNAYLTPEQAAAAFAAWRDAVPPTYRAIAAPSRELGDGSVFYAHNDGAACLVGFRVRNVFASVRVRAAPGVATADASPVETAQRLAGLVARRIEAVAGW